MSAGMLNNTQVAGSFALLEAELPALLRAWFAAAVHTETVTPAKTSVADPVTAEDWRDIRATLGNDGDAFDHLIRRYQQNVGAYMWRFTRDHGKWEELVHDAFVEAYLSLPRFQGRAPFLHWLKRIATRVGYRFWRTRQQRRRETPLTPEVVECAVDGAEDCSATEAAELVHCLLARLAPRDRLVLTLMYLEACCIEEIAELTGWSRSMVKVQAHRARKRLKRICEETGIEL